MRHIAVAYKKKLLNKTWNLGQTERATAVGYKL